MSTTPDAPPRTPTPLCPMHWIVGVAAITTTALIMGSLWAAVDRGTGIAATLIGLSVIFTAIGAVAVAEGRNQRRQEQVLAAIGTAVETVLGVANQAEWRGFAAGMRENLADDSTDGTVVPIPRASTGGNGRRRPMADS